jgi:hypothetical protein
MPTHEHKLNRHPSTSVYVETAGIVGEYRSLRIVHLLDKDYTTLCGQWKCDEEDQEYYYNLPSRICQACEVKQLSEPWASPRSIHIGGCYTDRLVSTHMAVRR